ncbi:hypothetical protein [Pantoea sp.]|uniref:hypothetical protein n=1 Tax=Pantoea sp. TaxID=69393 RepID=UPI002898B859|nr:hypothetical protein [Pantoea sp.]
MESVSLNEVNFDLESLEVAAIEICKTKGMLGLLLSFVTPEVQHSYFEQLKDAGLEEDVVWLQQIVEAK